MTDTTVPEVTTTERHMTVLAGAHATSEYGEGPDYCRFTATPHFVNRLRYLQRVLTDNQLSELRVYDGPERWGPGAVEDGLRLNCAELVLTEGAFWFADSPKHADYHINSSMISIQSLLDAYAAGEQRFLVEVSDAVLELIAEDEAQDAFEAEPFDRSVAIPADSLAD